jgi:flagellar protein FliO/FliZ
MKHSPAHFKYVAAACVTTFILDVAPAFAGTAADDKTPLPNLDASEPAKQAAQGGGGGGIARMIVGLAIVVGVIYGLAWVLRQVKGAKEGTASGAALAAISSLPLGPNRSVHLVRAGNDFVLLGAAEKGVTPIRTYTEYEAREAGLIGDDAAVAIEAPKPVAAQAANNFVELLRQRTVRK